MKKLFKKTFLIVFTNCFLLSSVSFAATVSAPVYQKLKAVDNLLAKKSYSQAENILKKRLNQRNSRYERAVLLRSLSNVYGAQKKYSQAITELEKSLNLGALDYSATQKAELTLGQYYVAHNQTTKALSLFQKWLQKNPNLSAKTAAFLATVFSQHQKHSIALKLINKAISATAHPPEKWQQLQLALSYKVKDYSTAQASLKALLKKEPDNKQHWQQLSDIYFNAQDYTEAANIKYVAYKSGFLTTEAELLDLAQLFIQAGTPYKAAQFLQQQLKQQSLTENIETLELLANAWLTAKEDEKAKEVLEKALTVKPKASLYEKLAQLYTRVKDWQQAKNTFQKALELGKFQQQGNSYLLLGICYYHLHDNTKAEEAFETALLHPHTEKTAQQWLTYLKKY